MSDKLEDYIWYEKYRPTTLDDMVLDSDIRRKILDFKEDQQIPHLLLVGTAGLGKTTLAKILVKDILDTDYLLINASDESGVDTIRSKVKSFATSASLDDKLKVVVFGEADGMSKTAQDSLKEIIEECSQTTRFIFTANDLSKLSEPIISRCQKLDLKFSLKDFVARCGHIVKSEGIKVDKGIFVSICKSAYPDFRKAIGTLQSSVVDGQIKELVVADNSFVGDLWEKIESQTPEEVRKFCIQNGDKFSTHQSLMGDMAQYSYDNFTVDKSRKLIMLLNKYLVQDSQLVDKELNFYCFLIEMTS